VTDELWVLLSAEDGKLFVVRKTYYMVNVLELKLNTTVLLESSDIKLLMAMRNLEREG
jgi:hypothetical protein